MTSSPKSIWIALIQSNMIKHWTKAATIFSGTYITLALLAPILMSAGLHKPGHLLYRIYPAVCHQDAYKSWLFSTTSLTSTPAILPSLEASLPNSVMPCVECSAFFGTQEIGWKTALCHRCTAIYVGVFGASLIYHHLKSKCVRIPNLTTYIYLAIGLLPIIIDTVVLTDSTNIFTEFKLRHAHIISTLTGGLFGTMSIWYSYPQIEKYCQKHTNKLYQQGVHHR